MTSVCVCVCIYEASDGKPKWSRTTPCVRDLTVAENKLWLLWLKMLYFNKCCIFGYLRKHLTRSESMLKHSCTADFFSEVPTIQWCPSARVGMWLKFAIRHASYSENYFCEAVHLEFLFFITITRDTLNVDLLMLGTMKPINWLFLIHAT